MIFLCISRINFVKNAYFAVQMLLLSALSLKPEAKKALQWINKKTTPLKESVTNYSPKGFVTSSNGNPTQGYHFDSNRSKLVSDDDDDLDCVNEATDSVKEDFRSLTPPISRNGYYSVRSRSRSGTPLLLNTSLKGSCHAKTRMGTPCKLSSLPGRDFCYRHQTGDSVIG